MTKLCASSCVSTSAGTIRVPDFVDVFAPPSNEELRSLFHHIHAVGLPTDYWNRCLSQLGVAKVSEIRSMLNLWSAWLWVRRWELQNGKDADTKCSWGQLARQTILSEKNGESSVKYDVDLFGDPTMVVPDANLPAA